MKKLFMLFVIVIMFSSCDDDEYPLHKVVEGSEKFVIYKSEKIIGRDLKYGNYKYAITDASGIGWTYLTKTRYNIGDTLKIVNVTNLKK